MITYSSVALGCICGCECNATAAGLSYTRLALYGRVAGWGGVGWGWGVQADPGAPRRPHRGSRMRHGPTAVRASCAVCARLPVRRQRGTPSLPPRPAPPALTTSGSCGMVASAQPSCDGGTSAQRLELERMCQGNGGGCAGDTVMCRGRGTRTRRASGTRGHAAAAAVACTWPAVVCPSPPWHRQPL